MTWIRFVLMLYFFMVAHKAACQTLWKALLEVYEDMVEVMLVLEIFFHNLQPLLATVKRRKLTIHDSLSKIILQGF